MAGVMEGPEAAPEAVPDAALDDVHERLRRFRPVRTVDAEPWELGVDAGWLMQLTRHWAEDYDWRSREDEIRRRPWVLVEGDVPMRLLHYRVGDDAPTVLLLHGWPDSVLRFDRVVPLLSDCNLIIPALPGFPFAAPVASGGLRARDIGAAVGAAVAALGYRGYVVSAGDVGTDVAEGLLEAHGDAVSALHFTDISQYHFLHGLPSDLTQEEQRYVEHGHAWQAAEGGYMHEQGTKPATIGTSFTPYAVASPKPTGRVERPTVFTVFPRDLVNAPRSFADRFFDVRDFRTLERGGHFAAWEQPSDYVGGVRSALAYAD